MFLMGIECAVRSPAQTMIDTQGCAFSYPLFWLSGTTIIAYVHYPTVSSDLVCSGQNSVSGLLKNLALPYYKMMTIFYGWCGNVVSASLVNSSWTKKHMDLLWKVPNQLVYPPCDLSKMQLLDATSEREHTLFSLAQFRPEKNHNMQLFIMDALFRLRPDWKGQVKLVVCGGCRNRDDQKRVAALIRLSEELDLGDSVRFIPNPSHETILELLSKASIGLHTMVDEHFGISIVEFMASGLITVANKSGGPLSDIIRCKDEGFLCKTIEEYAQAIEAVIMMPESRRVEIRTKTRISAVDRFHSRLFHHQFLSVVQAIESQWKENKHTKDTI